MAITLLRGQHRECATGADPKHQSAASTTLDPDLLTRTSWTDAHTALVQIKKVLVAIETAQTHGQHSQNKYIPMSNPKENDHIQTQPKFQREKVQDILETNKKIHSNTIIIILILGVIIIMIVN